MTAGGVWVTRTNRGPNRGDCFFIASAGKDRASQLFTLQRFKLKKKKKKKPCCLLLHWHGTDKNFRKIWGKKKIARNKHSNE